MTNPTTLEIWFLRGVSNFRRGSFHAQVKPPRLAAFLIIFLRSQKKKKKKTSYIGLHYIYTSSKFWENTNIDVFMKWLIFYLHQILTALKCTIQFQEYKNLSRTNMSITFNISHTIFCLLNLTNSADLKFNRFTQKGKHFSKWFRFPHSTYL